MRASGKMKNKTHSKQTLQQHIARQIAVELTAAPDVAFTLQDHRKKKKTSKHMLHAEDNLTGADLW